MKAGDIVFVSFNGSHGFATILKSHCRGQLRLFFEILFQGNVRMMHSDYMELINEST